MKSQSITLAIDGLGCGGSEALAVERALTRLSGVDHAFVNPATEMAYVVYDPTRADPDQLRTAIAIAGFGPAPAGARDAPAERAQVIVSFDTRRLALAAGLLLAALYALCIAADLLVPGVLQMYRIWELILIGVRWSVPWTLLLGLVEAFTYGFFGGWAFAAIYNVLPGRGRQKLWHW